MSPDGQVVRGEVRDDQNDQDVNVGDDEPIEDEKSPELVDSGNDSDQLIGSAEEDALKDSDDEVDEEGGGALNLPAAIAVALPAAYDEDVPERPPPNKKHKCLQVIHYC